MPKDTRQRIVTEALALASTSGLDAVTLGKLAHACTLSKSGLFAHFASKESLQLAIVEAAGAALQHQVIAPSRDTPPGLERVRRFFTLWLRWPTHAGLPGGCPLAAAAFELDDRTGPVRGAVMDTVQALLDTLADWLAEARERGELSASTDVRQCAWEIGALYTMHHVSHRLLADPHSEARALTALDRVLAR